MSFGNHLDALSSNRGSSRIMRSMSDQFNNPEMSDLELKVGNQTFYVHKFVLGLLSDVFRTMCSRRWEGDGVSVLQIDECEECLPVFERFLKFLYSGDVEVNISTALPLLMLADKYNVQPLKDMFEDFMKKTVVDGSIAAALRWFAYAQVSGHTTLQFSCVDVIIMKMDEVVASDDFLDMEIGFLVALLGRDDLVISREETIYDALMRWMDNQESDLSDSDILMLMKLVRFSMMLPEHLYGIELSAFYDTHKDIMAPILNTAHRFRSLATEVYDITMFSDPNFRPRNYTHRYWCHFMTMETNGDTFFQNSYGIRCVNHPVVTAPEQLWQIKIVGEKRCSRSVNCNKPTILPNLGYVLSPTMSSSAVKMIPLIMTIAPLRPIKQDIVVDISLYLVKKDRLSRYLCGETLKFSPHDYFSIIENNTARKCSLPGASSAQSPVVVALPKFNPSPMNFSVMFQQTQNFDKPEVTLRYNFTLQDFDHPAEIPCFKLNGPARMTNSVRIAIVFKPRFASYPPVDKEEEQELSSKPVIEENCKSDSCHIWDARTEENSDEVG